MNRPVRRDNNKKWCVASVSLAALCWLLGAPVIAERPAIGQDNTRENARESARENAARIAQPAADGDAPWFTNVAESAGIAGQVAYRTKWVDLNGDGWLDILLIDNGHKWQREFLAENHLPEGLPGEGANKKITAADWPGKPEVFALFDFDGDGTFTQAELNLATQMHQTRAYLSLPTADGTSRRFEDITVATGIWKNESGTARGRLCSMLLAGDVDNDGDLDLFAGTYCDFENPAATAPDLGDRSAIFLNDGTGAFTLYQQPVPADEHAVAARGPSAFPSTLCASCFVDVDGDGTLDLFTGSWYRQYGRLHDAYADRLYLGAGNGKFADVTEAAGLMLDASPFDALTDDEKRTGQVSPERARAIGRKSHRPTYGVAHADWDGDGDQDLFVMAYGRQWNLHWKNDGRGKFAEVADDTNFDGDDDESGDYPPGVNRQKELPFRSNGNTFDVDFGDYNNDGHLDAITGEIKHAWAGSSSDPSMILTNLGESGRFAFLRDPGKLARTHEIQWWNQGDMSVAWFDCDNDGWLDVLISSSDYPDNQVLKLYRQTPGTGRFTEVTAQAGFSWTNSTQLSLGDFDRDGDVDILVGNTHTRLTAEQRAALPLSAALFRNDISNRSGNHFVSLALEGAGPAERGANRSAVGARIVVTAGGQTITRVVSGGHGHVGHQDDFRQVIGVGQARIIDKIEIQWPGRAKRTSVFANVPVDKFFRAREGAASLVPDETRPTRRPSELEPF